MTSTVLCTFRNLGTNGFCLISNRTECQVWNHPRAGHRPEHNGMLESQRRDADRVDESACRHSSFTDKWSSRSCGDGLCTDSQVSKLLLNDTLPRIRPRVRGKRVGLFDMCVWRKVETVIHDQCQSSQSKSLDLEEMPDEVRILRRPSELMTSIRVALMGKWSSGPRPCPGPFSGQNFLNKAVETDSPSLRRAPHSQESSECLQTLTSQELINA